MITGKNIHRTFIDGDRTLEVLKGIDIHIKKGEFVSIIGRSGAGKSTLLYQLSLLDRPDKGEITLDGRRTGKLDNGERTNFRLHELGYVFQDYALVPELTAEENVMLPLIMRGLTIDSARQKARTALEQVGLSDRVSNLPGKLSGGEQQRVSVARAFAHKPKIIFADEPTANLDSVSAKLVLKQFLELHKQGHTIVMVTHEREYAQMTDRVITIKDGKIDSIRKVKKRSRK